MKLFDKYEEEISRLKAEIIAKKKAQQKELEYLRQENEDLKALLAAAYTR